MPTIPLSPGETFVLSKKNTLPYIKSSTDSVEQSLFIRNDIYVTGSAAGEGTTIFNTGYIELTNTNTDPYIVFKPSTVTLQNFVLGYDDSQNQFALGTGIALSPGATRTVFHVPSGSRTLHVDEGLTVTGSVSVIEPTVVRAYTYVITNVATASITPTEWNVPSESYDRLFHIGLTNGPTGLTYGYNSVDAIATLTVVTRVHDTTLNIHHLKSTTAQSHFSYNTTFPIPAYQTASVSWTKSTNAISGVTAITYSSTAWKLGHT